MAIKTLQGVDLSSAGSFVEAAALADGDTLVLPGGLPIEVTTGLDCSAFGTGINIIMLPGCQVKLGTYSTFKCKVLSLIAQGSGAQLKLNGAVTKAVIRAGCDVTAVGGAWSKTHVDGGSFNVTDGATVVAIYTSGSGSVYLDTHSSDRVDTLVMAAGKVTSRRDVQVATLGGGSKLRMELAATIKDGAGGGIANLVGDQCILEMANNQAATIDLLNAYAGTLEPKEMPATLTITNALRTVAAKIRNSWNGFSITYTNTPTDVGYGVATAPGAGASS